MWKESLLNVSLRLKYNWGEFFSSKCQEPVRRERTQGSSIEFIGCLQSSKMAAQVSARNMKRYFGWEVGELVDEYSFNWPQWVQVLFLSRQELRHVALQHRFFSTNTDDSDDECNSLRFLYWLVHIATLRIQFQIGTLATNTSGFHWFSTSDSARQRVFKGFLSFVFVFVYTVIRGGSQWG